MSNRDEVKPQAMMRYMEEDESAVAPLSHATRRVKIEENWTWNLRFLPVQMGRDKMPYVRLARHWRNKAPIYCPQWTPKSYGGDPEIVCPVCAAAERLIGSSSEAVRRIGFDSTCKIARKFWCLVFDMQDPRGRIDEMPIEEILNPYEMEMTKTTWEDFKKYQKLAQTRQKNTSDYLCLDLETGNNFLATSTTKGVRLDRSDPSQVFEGILELEDANWDKWVAKIWARVRQPVVTLPTAKQLDDFVAKIEEDAERGAGSGRRRTDREEEDDRGGRGGSRRGGFRGGDNRNDDDRGFRSRRRSADEDQGDVDEDRPMARRRREEPAEDETPPSAARRRAPVAEETEPEAEPTPPARHSAPRQQTEETELAEQEEKEVVTPPPRRSTATPAAPAPARRTREPEPEAEAEADQDPAPPPPTRRSAAAPAAPAQARRQAPAAEENGNGDDGDLGPQKPPARRSAAPQAAGVDEEEDNVPEEARDPAPAAKERVEEPPPAVAAKAPAPTTGKNPEELQARLARLNKRQTAV
jgi:hypothetical protein